MTLSAKERKERRARMRLRREQRKKGQKEEFFIPPDAVVAENYGGISMSEVLLEFADPILSDSMSLEEYRGMLLFATVVWNAASVDVPEARKLMGQKMKSFSPGEAEWMKSMRRFLHARKMIHFDDVDRIIEDIIVEDRNGDYYVRVLSRPRAAYDAAD